ncbi:MULTISPECIES: OmpA family protein [Flavobacteriaceae]|uniref:OmpA family protein n=1 Tax=Flavobacteriaceae TaxID=49546 RepID=UPI0023490CD8|nr:OmpA family protein [Muricauda sp. SP22]MDC6362097.1 OmpA family protein [Muricauda sp. SP22]
MKKLILPFLFIITLGVKSQEISLLQFDGDSVSTFENGDDWSSPDKTNGINHLENLDRKQLAKFIRKKGTTAKLIKKGDEYFEKMWYAEAARLYDIVLEKSEEEHTYKLLSRAGDSHYYSGNLEKSYTWYNELYERYPDEITEDRFFKYTHSLKGLGKYRRAAKLTKLFRQKREEPLNELEKTVPNTWKGAASVEIKNLSINSKYSDFAPMFHKDADVVFASARDTSFLTTRRYRWNNQPFLDLYVAKGNSEGTDFMGPKKFSKTINTKYHEASIAFSPDQKTVYYTRNNYGKKLKRGKNGINHLKIYVSKLINGEWTEGREVSFNSENYSTGHPAISSDGKKIYFVSDRPGGYGQTDIYVADILENNTFSQPTNLGRGINTQGKEMFPYVTEGTLYFSSDRAMGFGGLDIYKSDFVDNLFSPAYNLGQPVNSNRDDFSYIIDATGEKGYFASNRKGGKGDDDIYSFAYVLNKNTIVGTVKDALTDKAISEASVALLNNEGGLVAETMTNADGNYNFKDLNTNTEYTIKTSRKGYFEDTTKAATKKNERIEVSQSLKQLKEIIDEEKSIVVLEPDAIHFNFDQYSIRPRAAKELDKLVAVLNEYKSMVIKIEAHTDAIGSSSYNKYLSDKRAQSTRDYIISQGIDPSRIESAIGYGEERLLNNCSDGVPCSRERHQQNRRSEFIIVRQ